MPSNPSPIAIIADAHFHDLSGDYGLPGIAEGGRTLSVRPFADTLKSTRVFNESGDALRHALADISARGIRHVVLLGDYSDDGQAVTMRGLRALLDDHSRRHGTQFFAVPGNHDMFGPTGRHRTKRFLTPGGHAIVTSDPRRQPGPAHETIVVADGMRCLGYEDGLLALPEAGLGRPAGVHHWETPFGAADDLAQRRYQAWSPDGQTVRSLVDASYLVEPVDGLWMLMIDANVFIPVDGASGDDETEFADSTDAGWNAMLQHKRFVLDWMKEVAARAGRLGKTLVAFSHYPALDPLDGTGQDERAVLGQTSLLRRIPAVEVGAALIAAGIRVHFSGHLHINDTARMSDRNGFLVNVSVPALVAFPCAYKILRVEAGHMAVETVSIGDMPLDQRIMALYRQEAEMAGIVAPGPLSAENYGAFLSEHIGHLVGRRHLKREWPAELAVAARTMTLADVAGADHPVLRAVPVMAFLADWYRVRMGSDVGLATVGSRNLAAYRVLSQLLAGETSGENAMQVSFRRLLRMFDQFASGLPSRNFTIDMMTGAVEERAPAIS